MNEGDAVGAKEGSGLGIYVGEGLGMNVGLILIDGVKVGIAVGSLVGL